MTRRIERAALPEAPKFISPAIMAAPILLL